MCNNHPKYGPLTPSASPNTASPEISTSTLLWGICLILGVITLFASAACYFLSAAHSQIPVTQHLFDPQLEALKAIVWHARADSFLWAGIILTALPGAFLASAAKGK